MRRVHLKALEGQIKTLLGEIKALAERIEEFERKFDPSGARGSQPTPEAIDSIEKARRLLALKQSALAATEDALAGALS